jgi:hypothetical protein
VIDITTLDNAAILTPIGGIAILAFSSVCVAGRNSPVWQ